MKYIDVKIQNDWLHRRGFRGRWLTIYLHRYGGASESTERFHAHPWRWAISFLFKGSFREYLAGPLEDDTYPRFRFAPSLAIYSRFDLHRIISGSGASLFIGLFRTQILEIDTASCKVPEGFCHYTELTPGEPGFRSDYVA